MNGDDQDLLRQFIKDSSQDAFASLVRKHLDLVYSAALRQVRSPQLAEEVSQSVFADFAKTAAGLKTDTVFPAWLYQVTRRTAIDVVRRESRRQARERIAVEMAAMNTSTDWSHIEPLLDEAMNELNETDRTAVLLRYFKNQSLREVGIALGASDDSAQKRVSRAVERLREFFAKRGVTLGVGGIAAAMTANAIQAAPMSLAATIISSAPVALALTVTTIITTKTPLAAMSLFSLKTAAIVVATAVIAATGTYLVVKRSEQPLREANQDLAAQVEKLSAERDATISSANAAADPALSEKEKMDLARLRGDAGRMERQRKEIASLKEMNDQLQAKLKQAVPEPDEEQKKFAPNLTAQTPEGKLKRAQMLGLSLIMFAADSNDGYPTNFSQITNYLNLNPALVAYFTNEFEMTYQGSSKNIPDPANTVVIMEKQALQTNGGWFKTYGYADGHSEYKRQDSETGFADYEKQHILSQ